MKANRIARVVRQEKGIYTIDGGDGERAAEVSGRFRYEAARPLDFPTVGDWVEADCETGGNAVIHRVLERGSLFVRRAAGGCEEQAVAANVDTVLLCMALNGDFNLRRMERYTAVAWESGAVPVIVLTKRDLCADAAMRAAEAAAIAPGVDVLTVSSLETDGLAALMPYLRPGETLALLGSSGAGKSTLANRLLGEERLATNGLRNDDRGRHTTTRRQMIALACGAQIIDTPGMRELGMAGAESGLEQAFSDISALARRCRFRDCTHRTEPGCAVHAAMERGELPPERLAAWRALCAENEWECAATERLAAKRQKFKEIAKINRKAGRS